MTEVRATGRFSPLQPFLAGVLVSDLPRLTHDDIIQAAPPELRLLMTIFVKTELGKFLDYDQEVRGEDGYDKADGPSGMSFEDYLTTEVSSTEIVNLASTGLDESNMVDIAYSFDSKFPAARTLNLSSNTIGTGAYKLASPTKPEVYAALVSLLDRPVTKYVDISKNPISSADAFDLFTEKLTDEHYRKLIWVPQEWLETSDWRSMVPNRYVISPNGQVRLCDQVLRTHAEYYGSN